jgi:hypothetical protein
MCHAFPITFTSSHIVYSVHLLYLYRQKPKQCHESKIIVHAMGYLTPSSVCLCLFRNAVSISACTHISDGHKFSLSKHHWGVSQIRSTCQVRHAAVVSRHRSHTPHLLSLELLLLHTRTIGLSHTRLSRSGATTRARSRQRHTSSRACAHGVSTSATRRTRGSTTTATSTTALRCTIGPERY